LSGSRGIQDISTLRKTRMMYTVNSPFRYAAKSPLARASTAANCQPSRMRAIEAS